MDTSLGLRGQVRRAAETWQLVLAGILSVLLAAGLTLALQGRDPASAQTFITQATAALVHLPNGEERPARIGDLLPQGATIRTGSPGGARLTTDGRDVYLGALSTVRVIDGVREVLSEGQVLINNASEGPQLTLTTPAGTVLAEDALARVERKVATLRLGVYQGSASITANGRRATTVVPQYFQTRVPYGDVPEPPTALALTVKDGVYDVWEAQFARNLVQNDIDLNSFAKGLDGPEGQAVIQAASLSLSGTGLQGRGTGEQALSVAVAQKARLYPSKADNLRAVDRHRGDGGSWGVVSAILLAPVSEVTAVLGSSLDAAGPGTGPDLGGRSGDGSGDGGGSTDGDGGSRPTPTRTPTSTPTKTTSPPTRGPLDDAIDAVTSALPTPPPRTPPTPTPTPTQADPVGDVVDSVIGLLVP